MDQATDAAETVTSMDSFRRDLKTCSILFTGTRLRIDSLMRPRSSSRERSTSAQVAATVRPAGRVVRPLTYISRDVISLYLVERFQ